MRDELISFETAKLAKEKGFDIPCANYYRSNGNLHGVNGLSSGLSAPFSQGLNSNLAPTQSLLQRWLREKHAIFVGVDVRNEDNEFYFELQSIFEYQCQVVIDQDVCNELFYTYEEALELGLRKALETLLNKKH